jgi:hypothetical protein
MLLLNLSCACLPQAGRALQLKQFIEQYLTNGNFPDGLHTNNLKNTL